MAIGTTAALLGSAALGAAGSIASSSAQKKAAKSAASASQAATDQTIAEQRRQFDLSRSDMQPWLRTGSAAINQLANLYGLGQPQTTAPLNQNYQANGAFLLPYNAGGFEQMATMPSNPDYQLNTMQYGAAQPVSTNAVATSQNPQQSAMGQFFQSPDYQFRMNEAMRALNARNAALGIQDSGAAQKAALQQSGNLASGEFNNYANRLSALAGVGQTAAQNSAQLGSAMAGNIGNALANNAANLSSSYQNRANAQTGLYGSLVNLGGGILGHYGGAR